MAILSSDMSGEYSLLDIYDLAQEGEKQTIRRFMFLGTEINIQIEDDSQVYMWLSSATDVDQMFDTTEYDGAKEFEEDVDEWIEEIN